MSKRPSQQTSVDSSVMSSVQKDHQGEVELEFALNLVEDAVGEGFRSLVVERLGSFRRAVHKLEGISVPRISVGTNSDLECDQFRIVLGGVEAARGTIRLGHLLAIGPLNRLQNLSGPLTEEPTHSLPAKWVPENQRGLAESQGCSTFEPIGVVHIALSQVIRSSFG